VTIAVTVRDRALFGQAAEVIVAARMGMEALPLDADQDRDMAHRTTAMPSGWWLIPLALFGFAFWAAVLLFLGKALANVAWASVNGGALP
jgi:hypothetical protein